jgi:acyl transferase domain-containing protein/NAD(P)H-dependent flavin oxidoreductase YrpB (nitropropane dioxygenase family)/NAD(P)-dependent dehydrogenase (short-subunit alcohol dehydrogenase family)
MTRARVLEIAVVPPAGASSGELLRAVARAGELAIVELSPDSDSNSMHELLAELSRLARGRVGLRIQPSDWRVPESVLERLDCEVDLVLLGLGAGDGALDDDGAWIDAMRARARRVFCEVVDPTTAEQAEAAGADGLVAHGNEGGGRVAAESTLVLLQRVCPNTRVPVWARGGVGPNGAAAVLAAGCSGFVLDAQLSLTVEAGLDNSRRALLESMDGSETVCLGQSFGLDFRVFQRPGSPAAAALIELERSGDEAGSVDALRGWIASDDEDRPWVVGQQAGLARSVARRHPHTADALRHYRQRAVDSLRRALEHDVLAEDSELARAHGTRYPIVQGPMTRVSDTPAFAEAVADAGALPFLALALLRGEEARTLLRATADRLGERPWGVGILGFVPPDLRSEQLDAVLQVRPPFALLAGGRADQVADLEEEGIASYLHAPSPGLLELFLRAGARRFVLEGRECGGHVGPLGSMVLWESALEVLMEHRRSSDDDRPIDLLFAGGIHDRVGAAMVSALAAPAASAGIRIGVLMGSAYLFTQEAVASGAILEGYQRQALECRSTILLEAGAGHAVRCAPTPFADEFNELKRQLAHEGVATEELRRRLETLNVGRLRMATKGTVRTANGEDAPSRLVEVDEDRQSAEGMYMLGQIAALRDRTIGMSDLHRELSEGAAEILAETAEELALIDRESAVAPPPPIAIIGMACVFPGAADVDEYWRNILANHDAIREVPADRWRAELLYDSDPAAPDRILSKWGGFIDPVAVDPVRYGIPPTSLSSVEPMHLVMLEVARRALADAGYDQRPLPRERTAVIIGTAGSPWDLGTAYETRCMVEHYLDLAPGISDGARREAVAGVRSVVPQLTEDSFPGILGNVAAGRIANRLDLGGANFTVDAACAASLAALDCGIRELRDRTSDVVVLGGLEGQQSAFGFLLFSKTMALSPRGRCRPFDAEADGTTISEGAAAVILKRLEDAERDGDRVYAIVRSVGSSSDGRDKSLTAPSVRGQRRALDRAYAQLEFGPEDVALVEAHGTGTVVGDRAEFETLSEVFEGPDARAQSCALGSVKSQIGHTKNAAGLAGLIKITKAVHHRVLPPTLVDEPSEVARDRDAVLYLNTSTRPWLESSRRPRRAALSSFGFGGTNFHAVVEEHPFYAAPAPDRPAELLVFRRGSRSELAGRLEEIASALERGAAPRLIELASALGRLAAASRGDCRLAIVATPNTDLTMRLREIEQSVRSGGEAGEDDSWWCSDRAVADRIALLFPGQGSQYPNMLSELVMAFPIVAEHFERADRVLADTLERPLSDVVFPPPAHTAAEAAEQRRTLDQTWLAQPALGVADVAVLALLERLGISPDMVAGHSYGEYVALHAAGSLSFDELMVLSERRGRVVQETQGRDRIGMVAIAASEKIVADLLKDRPGVSVAGSNAPEQTIVGGAREAIDAWLPMLDREGVSYRLLSLSAGFHIPEAAAAAERFARELARFELRAPRIPVYANLTGRPHPDDPREMRHILIDQLTQPVRFRDQVSAMYAAGARTFVEVGPGQVLSRLARSGLEDESVRVLATDRGRQGDGLATLLGAVGELYAAGRLARLDALFEGHSPSARELDELLSLPTQHSATAWMVDGGSARPANGRPVSQQPASPSRPDSTSAAPPPLTPGLGPPVTPGPERRPGGAGGVVEALQATVDRFLDYQMSSAERREQLMRQVLETQRQLVDWYRGGAQPRACVESERSLEARVAPPVPTPQSVHREPDRREPTPAVAPAADDYDVRRIVLDVICERTGYPEEMLDEDLDLEGDLGIDSIKRTEIFGRVRERLGMTDEILSAEEFFLATSRLRTLRETLKWLEERGVESVADQGADVTPSTEPGSADSESRPIERFVVRVEDAPLTAEERTRPGSGEVVLVTEDQSGRARSAVTALQTVGFVPALVRHSQTTRRVAAGEYEVDLLSRPALHKLKAWIAEHHGPLTALCHMLPLEPGSLAGGDSDYLELQSLVRLASTFGPELRGGTGSLTAVSPLDGAFSVNGELSVFRPGAAAVTGFLRSLAREWPEVRIKSLRVDPAGNQELLLTQLLAEATREDSTLEVGYAGSRRRVLISEETSVDDTRSPVLELDQDSVVLVTGGARGISAAVCASLAERFNPRFILVGRSPAPDPEEAETARLGVEAELKRVLVDRRKRRGEHVTPAAVEEEYQRLLRARETRRTLELLAEKSPLVELHAVDVRDDERFSSLIDAIYERFGRIDGVIHGAGVVDDHLLLSKADTAFDRVFDTKVRGALTLARTLRPEELRFMTFFSSVAAHYGYAGGTDYAAANDVLNRLAWVLDRSWPGRVVSIGWGPWDEVGIASRYPEELHVRQGLVRIPPEVGCDHFIRELLYGRKGEAEVLIFGSRGGEPYSASGAPDLSNRDG